MSEMKLSAVFQLIDKITAPLRAITKGVKDVGRAGDKAGQGGERMGRGFARGNRELVKTKKEAQATKEKLRQLEQQSKKAAEVGKTIGTGIAATITGLTGLFTALGVGVFKTNAKFEKYEATLTTLLGSAAKAKAAMAWVTDFAATTPFEVDQVTEAFVKLNSYGIDATKDNILRNMGDWASGMGKSLDQVVEAFADARTGEFERLKELGVTSKTVGDTVTFSYNRMGKAITKTVKKNAIEITSALNDIATGFSGAMLRQSKTSEGIISNLMDYWTGFQKRIGDAGVFVHIKNVLGGFLDRLNALPKAQVDSWAKKMSDAFSALFDVLFNLATSIDWPKTIQGVSNFILAFTKGVTAIGNFVNKIGGLGTILDVVVVGGLAKFGLGLLSLAPIFGITTAAAAPWIAAIVLIGALAYLLIRHWDAVKKWMMDFWGKFGGWISAVFPSIGVLVNLAKVIISAWQPVANFFGGLWDKISKIGSKGPIAVSAGASAPNAAIGQYSNGNQSFSGHIVVEGRNGTQIKSVSTNNRNIGLTGKHGIQGAGR